MSVRPQVLDRLLLSKSFLDRVRFQPIADYDRHTLAANIIAAHDAAELAIAAVADELGCSPANGAKTFLMDYFDPIERATTVAPHGREYCRQLNTVRNQLKHQGLYPDPKQWVRVAESVHQHVTKWCSDYLKIHFGDLDDSALLTDPDVKRRYDEAKQHLAAGDYKQSLEKIALALALVFDKNAALRGGLEAGKPSSDDAIRLTGFAVHANDFLALQQFLPLVQTHGENAGVPQWKQSEFGHPGNWRESTASFCLRAFLDVAIKIQDARWIPGPMRRPILYDQQIEALRDGVEIWTEVRVNALGKKLSGFEAILGGETRRETVRTMKGGETLKAFVSIATETTGDASKDAFYGGGVKTGGVLSVMVFGLVPEANLFGKVLASDVKVTCVPKDEDIIKQYFPNLPIIDWQPE